MAHIFISYSKVDIDFARHLKRSLEYAGFVVWMDETAVRPSARWWPTIERNIETSSAVIVVMSPSSRESDWVEREILYAERLHKPIFPVLLAGEDWPRLANIQYADMTAGVGAPLPVELEDSLNGLIVPGKIGAVEPPLELPGERIPEPRPAARRVRSAVVGVTVLVLVVVVVVAGGLVLANRQNGDAETPLSAVARGATASAVPTVTPTVMLTGEPTVMPTDAPTTAPTFTVTPTDTLTATPTVAPFPTLAAGSPK